MKICFVRLYNGIIYCIVYINLFAVRKVSLLLKDGKGEDTNDEFRTDFAISRDAFERIRRNYESKGTTK